MEPSNSHPAFVSVSFHSDELNDEMVSAALERFATTSDNAPTLSTALDIAVFFRGTLSAKQRENKDVTLVLTLPAAPLSSAGVSGK